MKKVVVSLLVIMMALAFSMTTVVSAQCASTSCATSSCATTTTACPATTSAQCTSTATSACCTPCPTTCCCPTVCCCPAVVCCVATVKCCEFQTVVASTSVTPAVKAAAETMAKAAEGGQAAAQSSTGSTKSPQVINNNVWTQSQIYAPVNTFNIYKNEITGPTSTETISPDGASGIAFQPPVDGGSHVDVNVQGGVFWVNQNAKFDDQTMVNPTEIKNVEITKTIDKKVDIDKTITIDSNNS